MGSRPFTGRPTAVESYPILVAKFTKTFKLVGGHVERNMGRMKEQQSNCEDVN